MARKSYPAQTTATVPTKTAISRPVRPPREYIAAVVSGMISNPSIVALSCNPTRDDLINAVLTAEELYQIELERYGPSPSNPSQ